MFAVIVNTLAIVLGTGIGLLFRRGIPKHLSGAVLQALGICTVVIGIQGAIAEKNILVMIISCVIGVLIGELMDWEGHINRFSEHMTSRWAGEGEGAKIANAFVTSCLIMNVGPMFIIGSMNAGLISDFNMLYTKSMLDAVAGVVMGAAMGIGVMGSALFTLICQGGIVLLAKELAPYLADEVIAEVSCTGSLLIIGIGLNMLEITKFKLLNYLPALAVVPAVLYVMRLLSY